MKRTFLDSAKERKPLLGSFLSFNTAYAAQILARCGFDWLMIDMEHAPLSAQEATNMVHSTVAASQGSCMPIIRVPSHGVEWIKWALDSGADGIIIPMVNNKAEMDLIIKRALYPPAGARSSGVENANAIMSTPGVDGIFVGPVDLRSSMGFAGPDGDEEQYLNALNKLLGIGKRLNKPVGILLSPTAPKKQIEMGFDYFLMTGDADLMSRAAMTMLAATGDLVKSSRGQA
ncbi:hypothetical protein LTR56_001558 [Elasticomyces elasticus]|nr:hypothetical protein LTR56_001558 [Elasticomyces elasticus]KAK3668520.1 hypothetical protein LTR22_000406 [Elasticomyces elasticus]KAK4931872.1 hypothetical protein LTR49_001558 [Elasticomyces elasticus]KAK5768596.1 hypothetical protein LTS12_001385 [Elasticomyces elasticus]